jgi:hypothetical protein
VELNIELRQQEQKFFTMQLTVLRAFGVTTHPHFFNALVRELVYLSALEAEI